MQLRAGWCWPGDEPGRIAPHRGRDVVGQAFAFVGKVLFWRRCHSVASGWFAGVRSAVLQAAVGNIFAEHAAPSTGPGAELVMIGACECWSNTPPRSRRSSSVYKI